MLQIRFVDLEHSRRILSLPFPVMTAGNCLILNEPVNRKRNTRFELTLRLESSSRYACDRFDGVEYRTPFPNYVLKRSGTFHEYELSGRRKALFFIYSPEVERNLDKTGLLRMPVSGHFRLTGDLIAEIEAAERLFLHSRESYVADEIDLTAFQILQKLFFQQKRSAGKTENDHAEKMKQIASYLENTLSVHSLPEIAAKFGYSERTLFRHWKECFDSTPQQFILQRKIKHAQYLLKNSGLSIGEIARQLNFCDDNYFSACFRRSTGLTPRAYRKEKSRF